MKMKNKKAMEGLQVTIWSIASIALLLVMLFLIFAQMADTSIIKGATGNFSNPANGGNPNASKAIGKVMDAFQIVPDWFGILLIVALAFGILVYFMGKRK